MPDRTDDCVIYAKPVGGGHFQWGWRSLDRRRRSHTVFTYFYDCMTDARRHGYEIDLDRVIAELRQNKLSIRVVPKVAEREPQT